MALNPLKMMKLKGRWELFSQQHPKVAPFFQAARGSIGVGAVLEMKITSPEGQEMVTNIRLTQEDMETLAMLTNVDKDE